MATETLLLQRSKPQSTGDVITLLQRVAGNQQLQNVAHCQRSLNNATDTPPNRGETPDITSFYGIVANRVQRNSPKVTQIELINYRLIVKLDDGNELTTIARTFIGPGYYDVISQGNTIKVTGLAIDYGEEQVITLDSEQQGTQKILTLLRSLPAAVPLHIHGKAALPGNADGSGQGEDPQAAIRYNNSLGYAKETIRQIQLHAGLSDEDADGIFGPKTFHAVLRWQEMQNQGKPSEKQLVVDGKVGPQTYGRMFMGDSESDRIVDGQEQDDTEQPDLSSLPTGVVIVAPPDAGWKPAPSEDPTAVLNALLRYVGTPTERTQIHEHNIRVLQTYFSAYNQYLVQYRAEVDAVQSEVELRKLGRFQAPRVFPLEQLDATGRELKELYAAYDSDIFKTWKEIGNKIAHLRGEIPPGTIFVRFNFVLSGKFGIYRIDWESNLEIGTNGHLDAQGKKFTGSVELENPQSPIEGEISTNTDGEDLAKVSISGEQGGASYEVTRDDVGQKTTTISLEKESAGGKWGITADSNGKVTLNAPAAGFADLEVSGDPAKGEMFTGIGKEFTSKKGHKAKISAGVGFVGLSEDQAFRAFTGQGYFESDPALYEQMSWGELAARRFSAGLPAVGRIFDNAQDAYTALGFTDQRWSAFQQSTKSAVSWGKEFALMKYWSDLSDQERAAAVSLGYYDQQWNTRAFILLRSQADRGSEEQEM